MAPHDHDPLQPKSHDSNPHPPSENSEFTIIFPNQEKQVVTVSQLQAFPKTSIGNYFIVSTGHGTTGPFTFTGVALLTFIEGVWKRPFSQLEIISGDEFGNRVTASELRSDTKQPPIILAYEINGMPMTRQQGVVRMIVPTETKDALRQVKWISEIRIVP